MTSATSTKKDRLLVLDFLRGFFIVVIIIDHLWLFPSAWTFISGEARLWVTAAEGFVMISGFLIGYIRGFKGLKYPFIDIAKKLFARAAMLYFWMVIVSLGYIYIEWQQKVPRMPYTVFEEPFLGRTYTDAFNSVINGNPHMWIHFLYLYAIFLALSVGVVYLFRKRLWWVVLLLSLLTYLAGMVQDSEWMKWQLLFFIPSIIGFHFESIRAKWDARSSAEQATIRKTLYATTLITLIASVATSFNATLLPESVNTVLSAVFVIEAMSPLRVIVAGLWFMALAFIFTKIARPINNATHGIIEYFGTHSLTAYIVHGYIICLVNFVIPINVPDMLKIPYFTIIGLITLLLTYGLIRIPLVKRVIPR